MRVVLHRRKVRGLDIGVYRKDLSQSGLPLVAGAFCFLITLNLITFVLGPQSVFGSLAASPLGALLAPFLFDSWGTVAGLGGTVLLFAPILFATTPSERRKLSLFFVASSVGMGVVATILWDVTYDNTGRFGSGSSGIAITALGVLFCLALFGLLRLLRADT